MPEQISVVYSTFESRGEATDVARKLVEERLLACANVIDGMTSVYRWNDEIQQGSEVLLIGKTLQRKVPTVTERIQELHSYDCPCVVSWPLESVAAEYANWLMQELSEPS